MTAWIAAVGRFLGRLAATALPFAIFAVLVLAMHGTIGDSIGIPSLFRDDPDLPTLASFPVWLSNSPVVWGQAALAFLVFVIWGGVEVAERLSRHRGGEPGRIERSTIADRLRFIWLNSVPFLVLLALLAAFPAGKTVTFGDVAAVLGETVLGFALAVLFAGLVALVFHASRSRVRDSTTRRQRNNWFVRAFRAIATPTDPDSEFEAVDDFWIFLGCVLVPTLGFGLSRVILPCVALVLLGIWLTAAYFFVVYVRTNLRLIVVALFACVTIAFNQNQYANRFPGLGHYDAPVPIVKEGVSTDLGASKEAPTADDRAAQSPDCTDILRNVPPSPGPIKPTDALRAWARGQRGKKLVIVSVSGGAYRAGFWSALVLDEIATRAHANPALRDFTQSIELLTGASGGMVASAYLAALARVAHPDGPVSIETKLLADIDAYRSRKSPVHGKFPTLFPITRDGLSPVAQQLVQRDVPRYLLAPFVSWNGLGDWDKWDDRGLVLEQQWRTLSSTFSDLATGERDGTRPSIILSPMMIETGQPLLISNLDLSKLTSNGQAVELFRLFPEARSSLRLQTAVRMNASFPYVSPAISLPTMPTRRVVDAGYYDDYGVAVASAWLGAKDVQEWIAGCTSGVIVVQIRAYGSEGEKKPPSALGYAARFLTSPLEGLFAARDSSMLFRNASELENASRLYRDGFVKTCPFENRADKSEVEMSWYLKRDSLETMREQLKHQDFDCLFNAWKSQLRGSPIAQGNVDVK